MVMQAILQGGPLDGIHLTVHADDARIAIGTNADMRSLAGSKATKENVEAWATAVQDSNVDPDSVMIYELRERESEEKAIEKGWHGIPRLFNAYAETRKRTSGDK